MHTDKDFPTIMETFQKSGYLAGILGKVKHSTPKAGFQWDFEFDGKKIAQGRSPKLYHKYCEEFFSKCKRQRKPMGIPKDLPI